MNSIKLYLLYFAIGALVCIAMTILIVKSTGAMPSFWTLAIGLTASAIAGYVGSLTEDDE